MSDVTRILEKIDAGDPRAAEQLLPLVYDELRKLAAARLAHEKPGQTLQATALVHEAYLRLVGPVGNALRGVPEALDSGLGYERLEVRGQKSEEPDATADLRLPTSDSPAPSLQARASSPPFNSRGHFFGAAAEAMRRILVENARRKLRIKHGGGRGCEQVELADIAAPEISEDLLALDEALVRLAHEDPSSAELVKLRYFAGLTIAQAAEALAISPRQADFLWSFARAWLRREMERG